MPNSRELDIIMKMKDQATPQFKKAATAWGRNMTRVRQSAAALMGKMKLLAVVAIPVVAYAFARGIGSAERYGLSLDKMAKQTGVATDKLSRLTYAAQQEHGSQDALIKGLLNLTVRLGYAGDGMESYIRYFKTLGITYKDSRGQLRSTYDVFMDLVDVMSKTEHGAARDAAALQLLGIRGGKELLPFLELGRKRIKDLGDEAERLNVVLDQRTVTAMKHFDDKLTAVKTGIKGVWIGIEQGLLPTLQSLAAWVKSDMPILIDQAERFGEILGSWAKRLLPLIGISLAPLKKQLQDVRETIKTVEETPKWKRRTTMWPTGFGLRAWERYLERLRKQEDGLKARIQAVAEMKWTPPTHQLIPGPSPGELAKRAKIIASYAQMKDQLNKFSMSQTEYAKQKIKEQYDAWMKLFAGQKDKLAELEKWHKAALNNIVKDMGLWKVAAEQAAKGMQTAMSDFFFDAITNKLKTAEDYFRAFGRMGAQILAQLLAKKAMLSLFGSQGGLFSGVGKFLGLAKGGRIEQGQVQPLPYYAAGGAMVARGRAVPIVAHEGEWIGTPARLAAAGIGRGQTGEQRPIIQNVNIYAQDVKSFVDRIDEVKDHIFKITKEAIGDNNPIRRSF